MNNAYALLQILQKHAPSGNDQEICSKLYRSCMGDEKTMACALVDGLLYGNWPWVLKT